jgi:hypothetical protein
LSNVQNKGNEKRKEFLQFLSSREEETFAYFQEEIQKLSATEDRLMMAVISFYVGIDPTFLTIHNFKFYIQNSTYLLFFILPFFFYVQHFFLGLAYKGVLKLNYLDKI